MKNAKILFYLLLFTSLLFLVGCCFEQGDNMPPAVPRGVRSVTGDGEVLLLWYENTEPDLAGYRIYRSQTLEGYYYLVGETNLDYFLDFGLQNGETYFYAITAFDCNENESELSYDIVYDTPRPEGYNERLFDYHTYPAYAGWNFSDYSIVPYNHPACDFFYGYDSYNEGDYLFVGRTGGLIQDFGYTESLDEITYAPEYGWSPTGVVEAILGHSYIFWTWDNHFAKFRVTGIADGCIVFDWAYQIDPGNPELVIRP
jgi:hypothetical protein